MARPKTKIVCTSKGCGRPYVSQGLCRRHLQRKFATASAPKGFKCSIHGCARWRVSHGMCHMHDSRVRAHGHPGGAAPLTSRGPRLLKGSYITSNGYRKVQLPDGQWLLEHRFIMACVIGRPLTPYENVHHKDGNRLNNRRSNLELWVKWQPNGQRVGDLIQWARWVLTTYDVETT